MDLMDVGAWCVIFTKRLAELLSYENWFFSIFSDLWEKATYSYMLCMLGSLLRYNDPHTNQFVSEGRPRSEKMPLLVSPNQCFHIAES